MSMNSLVKDLATAIKNHNPGIVFRALEIGALQVGQIENFHQILEYFPGSEIIGFEVEKSVCEDMNANAKEGIKFFPYALWSKRENRVFYETNHPMCCSLYKPNEKLLRLFNDFEVSYLKGETRIDTIDIDSFLAENSVGPIDFIKIDVEGAELDIFEGGKKALKNVAFIVSEAEFIEHHEGQPLFGDLCKFLSTYDFMFHKFLNVGGRSLRSFVKSTDFKFASQMVWADVVFIRDILKIRELTSDQLLKVSFLAALYESTDLSYFCLDQHDKLFLTNFSETFPN